jgi:hypothetical protein
LPGVRLLEVEKGAARFVCAAETLEVVKDAAAAGFFVVWGRFALVGEGDVGEC